MPSIKLKLVPETIIGRNKVQRHRAGPCVSILGRRPDLRDSERGQALSTSEGHLELPVTVSEPLFPSPYLECTSKLQSGMSSVIVRNQHLHTCDEFVLFCFTFKDSSALDVLKGNFLLN